MLEYKYALMLIIAVVLGILFGIRFRPVSRVIELFKKPKPITAEDLEPYRGKWIAIYRNKVIAEGNNAHALLAQVIDKGRGYYTKVQLYYIRTVEEQEHAEGSISTIPNLRDNNPSGNH